MLIKHWSQTGTKYTWISIWSLTAHKLHVRLQTYTHILAHTHTHTRTYTHAHTHMHSYTYTLHRSSHTYTCFNTTVKGTYITQKLTSCIRFETVMKELEAARLDLVWQVRERNVHRGRERERKRERERERERE